MLRKRFARRESALALGVVLVAVLCSGQSCTPNGVTPLSAPIDDSIVDSNPILPAGISLTANAGQDQIVHENDVVTLHVTVNPEVDSRSFMYLWKQDAGPAVVLSGSTGSIATFIAPNVDEDTSFVFTVTVSNGTGSVSDSVMITVLKTIATAGNEPEFAPTIELSSNVTEGEAPLAVTFTAEIMQPGGGASDASCTWSFGDGTQAEGYSVTHTYSTAGSYIVTACITLSAGTMSCAEKTVKVTPAAAAVGGGGGGGGVVLPEPQVTYKISGRLLKADATPLVAAVVSASLGGGTTTTNDQGYYELTLNAGWDGTITPQRVGYTFTPASRSYTPLAADVTHDDFLAQPPANQPPVADGQSVSVVQSTATQITLTGTDAESQSLTFEIVSTPSHGTLSGVTGVSASSARVTYTPASGYTGTDSFTFRVNDGSDVSPAATVNITVTALPPSASYYVDTNNAAAADTNPGTAALPFKTIQKAANVVQAGDTVIVRGGVYSNVSVTLKSSGTATYPITFKACPGETVVLDGASAQWAGFQVLTKTYNVIEGFEIRNYTGHGVYLENDSNYCVIRECRIHHCSGSGVYIRGADYVRVEYNELYSNSRFGALVNWRDTTQNRSDYCVISHNIVYDNGLFDSKDANVDGLSGMAATGTVWEYNIVYNNADDGIDISSSGGCTDYPVNAIIRYNVTFNNGFKMTTGLPSVWAGNGIKVSTNAGGGHTVHHNVNFLNKRGGVDQDIEAGWDGNKYYNNIVWRNGTYAVSTNRGGFLLEGSQTDQGRAVLYNNIGWGNDPAELAGWNNRGDCFIKHRALGVSDYNSWGMQRNIDVEEGTDPGYAEGSHTIFGQNPGFVNPDGVIDLNYTGVGGVAGRWQFVWDQVRANFTLRSDSPCVGTGVAVPGITEDGISNPDMGVFGHVQ